MKNTRWLVAVLVIAIGDAVFGYAQANVLSLSSFIAFAIPIAYAGLSYWHQLLWTEAKNEAIESKRKQKLAEQKFNFGLIFGAPMLGLIVGLFRLSPTLILYFSLILIGYGVIYLAFRDA